MSSIETISAPPFLGLMDSIKPIERLPDPDALTVYSIVKDEMFFLPAFLEHHRSMGVEQFVFLDDHSTDGTRNFLLAQTDCVVLGTNFKFGDTLEGLGETPLKRTNRVGEIAKSAIPLKFFLGRYTVYLDADEFLILPVGVSSLSEVLERLKQWRATSLLASLVDFYPASISGLHQQPPPLTFQDLMESYGFFDGLPLLEATPGESPRQFPENGASRRIFSKFGIKKGPRFLDGLPGLVNLLPFRPAEGPIIKTPLVKWSRDSVYVNSHRLNRPSETANFIAIAHFKFSADLFRRINFAISSKSYHRKSIKYSYYSQLMGSMVARGGDFIGPPSRKYKGADDLENCGLICWEI